MVLQPQGSVIQATLGGAMLELGAWEESEALCRNATSLDPMFPNGYFNLSHALKATNQLRRAADRGAPSNLPCVRTPRITISILLIFCWFRAHSKHGWEEYDWRWKLPDFAWLGAVHGDFSKPRWTGEDISDKTILIYTEQGIGDIIQFARYLPLVVQKAKQVIRRG